VVAGGFWARGGGEEGSAAVGLTSATTSPAAVAGLDPSASRLAFLRDGDIWTMQADGSEETQLTERGDIASFEWSPYGDALVFETCPSSGECRDNWSANGEVGLIALDAGTVTVLGKGFGPSWSPDGRQVVYENDGVIYVATLDGEVARLTKDASLSEQEPFGTGFFWTSARFASEPDKVLVARVGVSSGASGNRDVSLSWVRTDGSGMWQPFRRGGDVPMANGAFRALSVSPHSQWVFATTSGHVAYCVGATGYWLFDSNGYGGEFALSELLPEPERDIHLAGFSWSPDGNGLAIAAKPWVFERCQELGALNYKGEAARLFLVEPGAGTQAKIADNAEMPRWSPDGGRIAFLRWAEPGKADIYIVKPDGTDERRLTDVSSGISGFSWSPDGQKMAFASDRDGVSKIYVVDAEGSNLHALTGETDGAYPAWSPRLPVPYVSLRSLLRPQARLEKVLYVNMDGSKEGQIVVQSEVEEPGLQARRSRSHIWISSASTGSRERGARSGTRPLGPMRKNP